VCMCACAMEGRQIAPLAPTPTMRCPSLQVFQSAAHMADTYYWWVALPVPLI